MEFFESINALTWPAATAILGSIVTVVVGLFGYLRAAKHNNQDPNIQITHDYNEQLLHDRVSILKDKISELDGDFKAIRARLDGVEDSIKHHAKRDIADFKSLSDKVEKIMEIIVLMLKDDR